MKEKIEVTCYGEKEIWYDREKAIRFYLQAIAGSDGAERDRYTNIYLDLMTGKNECFDEEPEDDLFEGINQEPIL